MFTRIIQNHYNPLHPLQSDVILSKTYNFSRLVLQMAKLTFSVSSQFVLVALDQDMLTPILTRHFSQRDQSYHLSYTLSERGQSCHIIVMRSSPK